MRKRTSRAVLLAVLALILLGMGSVYAEFKGNPFVLMTMRGKVMRHLEETYPSTEFTFVQAAYYMKWDSYGGIVHPASNPEMTVRVDVGRDGRCTDDFLRTRLEDEMYAVAKPLIDSVIAGAGVHVSVHPPRDLVDRDGLHFSPDMDADIFLTVRWRGEQISKQAFADQVAETIRGFSGWNIKDWSFYYTYDNYELILSSEQGEFDPSNLVDQVYLSKQKE